MMEEELALSLEQFRMQSVYSDETGQFRIPAEPTSEDCVEIRIRTGRGTCSAVFLCTDEREYLMEETEEAGVFSYWKAILPQAEQKTSYFFRLQHGESIGYYTKYGYSAEYRQEGYFQLLRNYQTPDWAKGAVMYQIFTDRFANGDSSNDVKTNEYIYLGGKTEQVTDWESLPAASDIRRFYGGDLQGVIDHLEELAALGVEVLYFNPLFVSPSNHKYDTQDYWHIDPHFGKIVTKEGEVLAADAEINANATLYAARSTDAQNLAASDALFATLTERAHALGMRVILDGVFNHCGAFHKWMDREGFYQKESRGAYAHADSPYREYFYWDADGRYEGWWNHENHPKLNVGGCAALRGDLLEIAKRWVSPPFCADGWRLDVAADLGKTAEENHAFWQEFRTAVKSISAEKLILAEHYGDASSWLMGDQWDSIMNYDAFMEPVTWFLTGVSKHSTEKREDLYNNADAFWGAITERMQRLPYQALVTAMNELSNHDHSRFLTRTNRRIGRLETEGSEAAERGIDKAVFREAVLLQMTWLGSPTIYYGDEAGLTGWTDPDNRRTYPWGKEDLGLIAFHKAAISLRKQYAVLRHGSLLRLFGEYGVIAYGRFDATTKMLVILNNTEERKTVLLPVWQIGVGAESVLQSCLFSNRDGFTEFAFPYPVHKGQLRLTLTPKSAMVLKEE